MQWCTNFIRSFLCNPCTHSIFVFSISGGIAFRCSFIRLNGARGNKRWTIKLARLIYTTPTNEWFYTFLIRLNTSEASTKFIRLLFRMTVCITVMFTITSVYSDLQHSTATYNSYLQVRQDKKSIFSKQIYRVIEFELNSSFIVYLHCC